MIIEIKGLPEGQTIKHINVDITFDESGKTITKVVSDVVSKELINTPTFPASTLRKESETQPRQIREGVEVKPIPKEMTDLEF